MAIPQIQNWQSALLQRLGTPDTPQNRTFLDAWQRGEGGSAANNPFNTTQQMPGSSNYNTNNGYPVQSYATAQQGLDATVQTLNNGRYGNILAAMMKGNSAMNAAYALRDSPWGSGALAIKILGGDPDARAKVATNAQVIQESQNTTGDLQKALDQLTLPSQPLGGGDNLPNVKSPQSLMDFSAPSSTSVDALTKLGGIAGRVAAASQAPIQMPTAATVKPPASETVTKLPTRSTKVPSVNVDVDHKDPLPPTTVPIINLAEKYLGTPYTWGGADPRKGFDCSGFVQWLYGQPAGGGIALGRTTYAQAKQGMRVDKSELQPGDVVFFEQGAAGPEHEGLYIGAGQFIHSPHTGDSVKISSLGEDWYAQRFVTARRFRPDNSGKM